LDLEVDLTADRITGRSGLDIADAHVSVVLEDDRLQIRQLTATYEGGSVRAALSANATAPNPTVSAQAEVRGMSLEAFTSQIVEDPKAGGTMDLSMDLRSEGLSVDALRSNLAGEFGVRIREWSLVSQYSRTVVKNLTRALIPNLRARPSQLACLAAGFDVDGGRARARNLVLHDDAVTIRGSGYVDFGMQKLKLNLVPEVHDPGLLSIAAEVRVRGSFVEPTYRAVPFSIAASGGRGLVRNMFKPGSRILGLFSGPKPDAENPCDVELPLSRFGDYQRAH
jgi:uncharacterized protein involved in outer membrane biogenesis